MPVLAHPIEARQNNPSSETNKGRDIGIIIACVAVIVILLYLVFRLGGYNVCARCGRSTNATQGTTQSSHIDPALLMQLAAHRSQQANLENGLLSPIEVELLAPRRPYTGPESNGRESTSRLRQGQSKKLVQTPPAAVHRDEAMRGVSKQKTRRITFALPSKRGANAHKHQDTTSRNLKMEEPYVCSICLETFQENQLVRLTPCRHEFHSHCLEQWLTSYKDRCPLCQASVRVSDMLLER
jgi:hypothetical protein